MRAAIFRQGEIVVDNLPEPRPGPGQVLVKSLACGICGSDLHARLHARDMVGASKFVSWRKPMDLTRDVVFGHEFCAEVIEYGPGCKGTLGKGARVVSVPRLITDGVADGIGYSNTNVGAYAERMLLSESLLLPVPDHVPSDVASLTEPLAVGIHAVAKARLDGGEVPLVIGCGPIGLAVIVALRHKGIGPIVAADFSPKRREIAARLGADVVVDPAVTSPYRTWEEHAGTSPPRSAAPVLNAVNRFKPAVIFECVGVPGIIQSIFEEAPPHARVVVVGVCMETDRQQPILAIFKELNLQYVLAWTAEEFAAALDIISSGRYDLGAMITDHIGLDQVAGAFQELASPNRHTKIIIEPWRDA